MARSPFNQDVDIAKHTEYRDKKIFYGLLLALLPIIFLVFYFFYSGSEKSNEGQTGNNQKTSVVDKTLFRYPQADKSDLKPIKTHEVEGGISKNVDDQSWVLYQYEAGGGSLKMLGSNNQSAEPNVIKPSSISSDIDNTRKNHGTGKRDLDFDPVHGYKPEYPSIIPNPSNVIPIGTLIPAVLDFAIDSALSGPLKAHTTEHVFSADGKRLIIPKGSELIGQYSGGVKEGDTRVFFVWERLRLANGLIVDLQALGLDQIGRSGIGGDVDERFAYKFGAAILLSILDTDDSLNFTFNDNSVDINTSLERVVSQMIRRRTAIPPIIRVPQGQRFNIFVRRDIDFTPFL